MAFDWSQATIGQFIELQRGNTYRSELLDQPGPVLLGLASIERDGGFRSDKLRTYGGDCPPKLLVFPGDIYVSLKDVTQSGDLLGSVARVPETVAVGRMTQDTVKLIVKNDLIDRAYLYWVLRSPEYREYCRSRSMGTTNLSMSRDDFLSFPVPEPSDARLLLVKMLDNVEAKISLNRRINQTLEAMAQAIFKSWFVDFDPVKAKIAAKTEGRDPRRAAMSAISGKTDAELDALPPEQFDALAETAGLFPEEMEESELGEIPEGWMNSTLGELCKLYGGLIQTGPFGSQLHAHDYTTEGIPVVMPQDLSGRRINIDKIARIGDCDAERLHRHRIQAGDIVFSRRGDVGRHALVTPREIGWLCGTGCLLVRPSTRERVSAFVSCALARAESLEWLTRHAVGATMPNLNTTILSSLPIVLVPSAVLTSFQDRVGAMEAAMNVSIVEVETLSELRDTLLPKLLSGELAVTAHEVEAMG